MVFVKLELNMIEISHLGNFLVVLWLGLCTSWQGAGVRSLVRELRSRKPLGKEKKEISYLKTRDVIGAGVVGARDVENHSFQ